MKCKNCDRPAVSKELCKKHYTSQWRLEYPGRWKELQQNSYRRHSESRKLKASAYYDKNCETRRLSMRTLYQKNKEERKAYESARRQANPSLMSRYSRLRRIQLLQATPKWLSAEMMKEMTQIYLWRPDGAHVDHIIPINGLNVCGLHVPWNLQYLSAEDNRRKRNRLNLC